jgi:hypothetical protein
MYFVDINSEIGANKMGLFNFLFNHETGGDSSPAVDTTPAVNCDGTPMIPGSNIDIEGNPYGVCDDDSLHSSSMDDSMDKMSNDFDDSFSSFDDDTSSSFDDNW